MFKFLESLLVLFYLNTSFFIKDRSLNEPSDLKFDSISSPSSYSFILKKTFKNLASRLFSESCKSSGTVITLFLSKKRTQDHSTTADIPFSRVTWTYRPKI